MYAMRDIEAGEELSYDYNYGRHELQAHDGRSNNPETGKQRMKKENESTHIKCYCGAQNCREWLWRPMHTAEDSEDSE
jgi:SET domain-containing protein